MNQDSQTDNYKRKVYNDGIYLGTLVNDKRIGVGKFINENGDVYIGEWISDKRHGLGKMIYSNGTSYDGDFEDGIRSGRGTLKFANGDIYRGDFKENLMSGKGTMLYKNGEEYNGEFSDNKIQGKGILKAGKFTYEGNFANGLMHGVGKIKFDNGDTYEGNVENDEIRGFGKLTSNNILYEGHFKDCKLNGFCIETNKDKKYIFKGEFVDDKKVGVGMVEYESGEKYVGDFKNNYKDGNGKINFENGDSYVGEWRSDFISGKGLYTYKNGDTFNGSWLTERKMGFGILKIKNKSTYLQYWYDDKLMDMIEVNPNIKCLENITEDIEITNKNEFSESELEKIICPISQDWMYLPVKTSCNHSFCKLSLQKIIKNECPLCRGNIEYYCDDDENKNILNKIKFIIKDKEEKDKNKEIVKKEIIFDILLEEIEKYKTFINKFEVPEPGSNQRRDNPDLFSPNRPANPLPPLRQTPTSSTRPYVRYYDARDQPTRINYDRQRPLTTGIFGNGTRSNAILNPLTNPLLSPQRPLGNIGVRPPVNQNLNPLAPVNQFNTRTLEDDIEDRISRYIRTMSQIDEI